MSIERFGDYQLLKKLATGGMAEIWLARQQGLEGFEKLLVVKRILPHLAENSEFVKMFLDEARIAARLNHPNIVQIFNLGAQDDTYFIAMEYIHGEDVRRAWKRADAAQKPIPVPLVCRIIMDASAGLDYAHKKTDQGGKPLGIVHRDISPQNILVTFEGGVKVVDFGIAKAADQATVTRSGVLKGKYSYMSPEQASGMKVDSRSDIFALGVVLYELLTLTRLFKRSNDIQTLNAVTECDVLPPSKVRGDRVPASLDPVVMKALAKNPADRWQTANDLQAALENWLLQNQFPSSSVHLAAFLQDIYADRLAREAQEGQILIESLDQSRELESMSKEKASRSGAVSRPRSIDVDLEEATKSVTQAGDDDELPERATPGGQYNDEEAPTRRERSGSQSRKQLQAALDKEKKSQSGSHSKKVVVQELERRQTLSIQQTETQRQRSPSRGLLFVAAVAAAVIGVLAVLYFKGTQRAEVHLTSEPTGAAVRVDGRLLSGLATPCQLPPMRPGVYRLKLIHPGYQDFETEFTVPLTGEVQLGPFKLEANAVATGPDGGAAVSPFVSVTLKVEPPEAELYVDGKPKGKGALTFQEPVGATLRLEARLEGYVTSSETVTVHDAVDRMIRLEKAQVRDSGAAQVVRDPPEQHKIVRDPPPQKHEKQYGMVRFVVKPWANVSCGTYKLGQTPFGDTPLPVGTYECTLTTDDYPSRTVSVTVKPNETSRVAVNF
ncbi:MAG: serine/threonine-protein kinase [Myxococcaceae bacterium]